MEFLFSLAINKYNILVIFWNIVLALVPCFVVYYLAKAVRRKKWKKFKTNQRLSFGLIFLFWLFMFPNSAYLFTMVRHLVNYCDDFDCFRVCVEEAWMVMFFFTYALIGVPTFYYALKKMNQVFKQVFNDLSAALLPIIVIPLTSIAVMFGLFERYNSWEVLTKPLEIIKTGFSYFTDLNLFFNFLTFTLSLYLIYYGLNYFIRRIL